MTHRHDSAAAKRGAPLPEAPRFLFTKTGIMMRVLVPVLDYHQVARLLIPMREEQPPATDPQN